MLQNILRLVVKVGEHECHMLFPNGMAYEALEKMCLEFIQQLGAMKSQQIAQVQTQESAKEPEQEVKSE